MHYKPIIDPQILRPYYSKTLRSDRILLSAHSHQAWPDIVEKAQLEAVNLAHKNVDLKWEKIFGEVIPKFQTLVAGRAGINSPELIANGENTHDLLVKVLSCFDWNNKTKIVTTDSEFFSLKRQLYRLKEEGVEIEFVSTKEKESLTERLINAINPSVQLVIASSVFFNDGYRLQQVSEIAEAARQNNAVLILDVYHHFNVRTLEAEKIGKDIFLTAGGYKYASSGEGAAWLKVPENCTLRPKITGWFADFESLEDQEYPYPVKYGDGYQRFMGATRDISGILRQIAVFEFMDSMHLFPETLEQINIAQADYLIYLFEELKLERSGLKLLSSKNSSERGAFIAIDMGDIKTAAKVQKELWDVSKVLTDTRGKVLRIGPAPYTSEDELIAGMESLKKVIG